jgi:actin-like ATPase involved in cell morphogenesis
MIPGLGELVAEETGLDVRVADEPIKSVAHGTAMLLQRLDEYEDVLSDE